MKAISSRLARIEKVEMAFKTAPKIYTYYKQEWQTEDEALKAHCKCDAELYNAMSDKDSILICYEVMNPAKEEKLLMGNEPIE